MAHPTRRLFLLSAAALAGCGFHLRQAPELHVHTVGLVGFSKDSPLAAELRRQISHTPVKLMADANKAELVLEALRESRDKVVEVQTTAGQVREWQLRLQVDFQVGTPAGEILLPRTELRLTRDMNYTEEAALAKEQEEAMLYRAMQSDAVAQMLRRLAAVRLPD